MLQFIMIYVGKYILRMLILKIENINIKPTYIDTTGVFKNLPSFAPALT